MRVVKVNGTNRKPFASILYKFLLVVLCAAVRKAAVLQMKWLRARLINWPLSLDSDLP